MPSARGARLVQSAERVILDLGVVSTGPTVGPRDYFLKKNARA